MPRTAVLAALLVTATTAAAAEPAGRWRLEGKPGKAVAAGEAVAAEAGPAAKTVIPGGSVRFAADVPARYLYDPATGKSSENRSSLAFVGEGKDAPRLEVVLPARTFSGSFTAEAFVKVEGDPRRTLAAFFKNRRDGKASEFLAGARFLKQFGQTYWGGAYAGPGGWTDWTTGPYTTIARLTKETTAWRHVALVYDADRKTMTVYLDHWQADSREVPGEVAWDDAPLAIGGGPEGGFDGLIDEVRVTPALLSPAEFLRAVESPLEGVSFKSEETVLPRGSGYVDLKEGFGAVGDGRTDDTRAVQKAFDDLADKIPLAYHTLYVPPGIYLLSGTVRCSRFIVIRGAGPGRTTFRLKDRCAGFTDPGSPRALVRCSSTNGPPESARAVNGSSIGLYVAGLTVDTGTGNPGARALEYHSNNHGALEDAVLRSGDGEGVTGLDLTHRDVGPALVKNVRVEGFAVGVHVRHAEYSITFENLTLTGQGKTGLLNEGNIVAIRRLRNKNAVPALVSKGAGSMAVLLDSELTGGDASGPAITAEGGLFARNVQVAGYGKSIEKTVVTFKGGKEDAESRKGPSVTGNIDEYVGDHIVAPRGGPKRSLNLPVEDTPEVPAGDLARDWVNVRAFAGKKQGNDWGPAIQAAIDSGARTVYFPQGGYEVATPVHLRGKVQRLYGSRGSLYRAKSLNKTAPVLIHDAPEADSVTVVEHLDVAGLEQRSPGTLVLRHSTPQRFTNARGAGKLFLEDVMGADWHFDHPQQVWARQWNPESHEEGPCIASAGATIWALGFKTEYESSKLRATAGARTEILGGFIYPVVQGIPKDRPVFANRDSSMCLVYGMSVYTAGHDLQVLDRQGDDVKETRTADLKQVWSRFRMDLYVSRAAGR